MSEFDEKTAAYTRRFSLASRCLQVLRYLGKKTAKKSEDGFGLQGHTGGVYAFNHSMYNRCMYSGGYDRQVNIQTVRSTNTSTRVARNILIDF